MRKAIQCKDVDKVDVLRVIEKKSLSTIPYVMLWEIEDDFPNIPNKVILAKLRQMVRAGWITGCGCGCRGDFEIADMADSAPRAIAKIGGIAIEKDGVEMSVGSDVIAWLKREMMRMLIKEENKSHPPIADK